MFTYSFIYIEAALYMELYAVINITEERMDLAASDIFLESIRLKSGSKRFGARPLDLGAFSKCCSSLI
jgi:hypothetical protein